MRNSLKFFVLLFLIWEGTVPAASAHTPSDPNFLAPDISKNWKTLQTPHFRIHHDAAHKAYAQQMGAVAERVHEKLSPWLGWEPQEKTEVVILDSVDYSNGGATPLPYNQFFIYMPTPVEGEIMDNNPWMELVFTHEYVHILHLDMAFAFPKMVRKIFGRSTLIPFIFFDFPQLFAPSWVTEGIAVYGESDNDAGYGRLNNAWYDAMMRMEVQRGLRSLTEESFEGRRSRWPYGQIYLYGAYFYKFVEERYGRDKVVDYVRVYGRNVIPWRMDKRAKQIFGKPAKVVWKEYQDYLKQRFEPQLASLKQKSAVTARTVYDAPYTNNLLTAAGNGDLYFYHDDDASHPRVHRLRADGSDEALFEADEVMHLDWQDQAGLLVSKLTVCDNTNAYADLYRWKPGMWGEPERLTHCGRYPIAAWRADGGAIAAVQLDQGLSRLVLLDANGEHPQTLAELPQGDALGHLAWSPDNTTLVVSVKRLHSGWHLELFDLASKQWRALTLNGDREIRPRFSKDGSEIYFLSDHDKVWNLRRIKLGGNAVETLSNTLSGLHEAVQMPDNSYRLVEYTPQGLAISALESPAKIGKDYIARDTHAPQVQAITTAADYQPVPYEQVENYSAFSTMAPRSWAPTVVSNADTTSYVGVLVNGSDVLGFHSWVANPTYYTTLKALGGYASYDFHNTLTLSVMRQFIVRSNVDAAVRYRDDEGRYQALLGHSFNSFDSSRYIAAGLGGEKINSEIIKGAGTNLYFRDTLAGTIARYDSTEYYRQSISALDGRRVQLSWESYDIPVKNFYAGKAERLDWKEYLGLGKNHVLMLRWQRALGDPGIRPYVLGGETPPLNPLGADIELGRRNFNLRGYPSGSPSLVGTHFEIATAEWRIPLGMIYDGFFVPPLGVGQQALTLFVDRGDAWSNGEKVQLKTGAGLEWSVETLIGYDLLHLGLTLGYAHGFDKVEGGNRLYLRLGMPL